MKISFLDFVKSKVIFQNVFIVAFKQLIWIFFTEKASKLDDSSRKQYAEQVAIKFWNSISDDKDEISGFSSEEEAEPNHVYI